MTTRILMAAAAASLLLGGCSTLGLGGSRPLGTELVGNTLRTQAASGPVTNLSFRRDGTVRASFGKQQLTGRWEILGRNLCFFWPRAPRECWPYRAPFRRGETRSVTSDRGNVLRVTFL